MNPLQICLLISCGLFAIGLTAALARSNSILVLLGIELMLNAANLNFIAFWRFGPSPAPASGVIFVLFSLAIAAAEAAVGLALVIAVYRHQKNIRLKEASRLKG
ncbi:MAG: NADH-quinone oxidoreductase subunit NuoK [Opitutus sp.]|nr:NADH-quinone oxidoreductase subunit NuoK [Opitutus sp.]